MSTDTSSGAPAPQAAPGGTGALGGRPVSRIGFGAMQLPGRGVMGPPRDHDQAVAVLRRVVERGVNHIDTSWYYGPFVSNELIREALHPYPDDLVVVTKLGARRDDTGGWLPYQRPEELRAGLEEDLRTLGVEQVDVTNLRLLDPGHAGDSDVALDDQLATMVALREEGKIGDFGVSTVSLEQLQQALPAGPVCVQNPYSLLDRSGEPVLQLARANGLAWVPYFPLGSAFPGMPKVTENEVVVATARRLGATPAQVGLAWLLAHDPSVLLIPGTGSLDHLEENLAAGSVVLDDEALAALDPLA